MLCQQLYCIFREQWQEKKSARVNTDTVFFQNCFCPRLSVYRCRSPGYWRPANCTALFFSHLNNLFSQIQRERSWGGFSDHRLPASSLSAALLSLACCSSRPRGLILGRKMEEAWVSRVLFVQSLPTCFWCVSTNIFPELKHGSPSYEASQEIRFCWFFALLRYNSCITHLKCIIQLFLI